MGEITTTLWREIAYDQKKIDFCFPFFFITKLKNWKESGLDSLTLELYILIFSGLLFSTHYKKFFFHIIWKIKPDRFSGYLDPMFQTDRHRSTMYYRFKKLQLYSTASISNAIKIKYRQWWKWFYSISIQKPQQWNSLFNSY